MTALEEMQHVVVTGHGRSGTNLVLDLLDTSADTICRNEANEVAGAHLNALEPGFFPFNTSAQEAFERLLHESIYYRSARDRFLYRHKTFYQRTPLALAYLYLLQFTHARAKLHPKSAHKEWKLPAMVYNQEALKTAVGVHKILLWPARLLAAQRALHTLRIIHVIRAPEAFLQSWYARYVLFHPRGAEYVFEENCLSGCHIASHFGRDTRALYTDGYSLEALLEGEAWRWRYVNEVMFDALKESPRYLLVNYADLMRSKSEVAEQVASFCGLEFSQRMHDRVGQNQNRLFTSRNRQLLDPELVARISNRVLENSTLSTLFELVPKQN